jgi:hypothetical protein
MPMRCHRYHEFPYQDYIFNTVFEITNSVFQTIDVFIMTGASVSNIKNSIATLFCILMTVEDNNQKMSSAREEFLNKGMI